MEALLNNLIKATGWSIIHSLWQGALIYGLFFLTQMSLVQLKAKTKYMLAYSASSLMFICFAGTFIYMFHWPVSENPALGNIASGYPGSFSAAPPTLIQYAEMLFPYLACFYGIGIIIQSVLVYAGYRKITRLKKAAHLQIPESWKIMFEALTKKLAIKQNVSFWLSEHVHVPLLIGYAKPVILFPVALITQMDLNQVEAILIHELSHIKRNDYLLNLIRTMIDTVLFFNPFIWLTGKFIDIEREHACDDLVVELTNTPMTYAHALLKLELLSEKSDAMLAMAATGKKQYLYQRIKRITDMKTNYMNSRQKLFAVTLTIATVISLAWINPAQTEELRNSKSVELKPAARQFSPAKTAAQLASSLKIERLDTTKKKQKKKITGQGITDSNTVILTLSDKDTDSIISYTVNNSIKTVDSIRIHMDSLSGGNHGYGRQNIIINGIGSASNGTNVKIKDLKIKLNAIPNLNGNQNFNPLSVDQQEKLAKLNEQIAKINKEMQKQINPKQLEKLKKAAGEMKAASYTAKQQETLKKLGTQLAATNSKIQEIVANHPGFKNMEQQINASAKNGVVTYKINPTYKINVDKITSSPDFKNRIQELKLKYNTPIWNYTENKETLEIVENPEYIALKKKFDDDVKALMEKEKNIKDKK